MGVVDARTWMEDLSPATCWALLAATPVGRVAVLVDGEPDIYPVTFAVDERTIVFRTAAGTKLRGLAKASRTCFEVDELDPDRRTGWSVVVKGRAEVVTRPGELGVAARQLAPWASGTKDHWMRIRPTAVTGRRLKGALPDLPPA